MATYLWIFQQLELCSTRNSLLKICQLHSLFWRFIIFHFIGMPACCAITCKHGYKGHFTPEDVQWFHLPKDDSLRKAWLFRIHRENEADFVSEHTVLCSYHFTEEDWIPQHLNVDKRGRKLKRRRLKINAIPSINLRPNQGTAIKIHNSLRSEPRGVLVNVVRA